MLTVKRILHPTDLTELSLHTFHLAHALAQQFGARLVLAHVHQPQEVLEGEFGMLPPEPELSDAERLEKLQAMVPPGSTVAVEPVIVRGAAGLEIVNIAKSKQADLIVMSTHGRGGLARMFLGSVADQVLRNAPCPVLTLRSPATEHGDKK